MSTEMTSDDFFKAAKGPFGIAWKLGKLAYKGAKEREQEANVVAKEQERIEKYKSELREIGLGDVNSVKNALQQRNITLTEYMAIVNILKS